MKFTILCQISKKIMKIYDGVFWFVESGMHTKASNKNDWRRTCLFLFGEVEKLALQY